MQKMAERDPVTSGLLIRSTTGDARINPLQRAADRAADAMIRYSGEFGFSPAARARIAAGVGGFSPQAPSKFGLDCLRTSPAPMPLALSDRSMQTLIDLAATLAPADRSKFLCDVAAELARYPDVGDSLVTRIARKSLTKFCAMVCEANSTRYRKSSNW